MALCISSNDHTKPFVLPDDEAESILKIFREKRDEIARTINIPILNGDSKST